MTSAKKFAWCVSAGTAVAVSLLSLSATAATLAINDESLAVQTPTAGGAGISYVLTGASQSTLKVYTKGFLFCSDISSQESSNATPATFLPSHEDQSFTPAHPWSFGTLSDIRTASYTGGLMSVNRIASGTLASTLACQGVGSRGENASGLTDGIFSSGTESAQSEFFGHMINWKPKTFDWSSTDWSPVPVDPCDSNALPQVTEDVACAAITGARPGTVNPTVRAPTAWTASDATKFTYVFRVDARFGAQAPAGPVQMQIPTRQSGSSNAGMEEIVALRDAYDSTFLQPTGQYCFLTSLPSTLNSNVCNGAGATTFLLNGQLDFTFSVFAPPVGSGYSSFYVAVVRPIGAGSHANFTTPTVGMSALVDPVLVAEGGDKFSGDDVLFGFMPNAQGPSGFPWMNGQ